MKKKILERVLRMHDAGQQAGEIPRSRDEDTGQEKCGETPLNSITTKTEITRADLCIRISRQLRYIQLSQNQTHEKRERVKKRRVGIKAPPICQFPPG